MIYPQKLKNYNISQEIIKKINLLLELLETITDIDRTKINNTIYCCRWVLQNLSVLSNYKIKEPTFKQRKDAIDVTKEIAINYTRDEKIKDAIKFFAEYYKIQLDNMSKR